MPDMDAETGEVAENPSPEKLVGGLVNVGLWSSADVTAYAESLVEVDLIEGARALGEMAACRLGGPVVSRECWSTCGYDEPPLVRGKLSFSGCVVASGILWAFLRLAATLQESSKSLTLSIRWILSPRSAAK